MTNLSDIIPNLNPANSGFDIGTEIVEFMQRATDITLTTADVGKTIFINATAEIDVTLPSASAIGAATRDAFGLQSLGAPINLRDADGNLLAAFDGMSVLDNPSVAPDGMVGCILHLIDAASTAGKWIPGEYYGTIYAPKLVDTFTATKTTMDMLSLNIHYGGRFEKFKANNPVKLDNDRALYLWRQVGATGARAVVVKLNRTTGAITMGSAVTLDVADSAGIMTGVLMEENYGVNNTDIVLVTGISDGSDYGSMALEIDDMAITAGARAEAPTVDTDGDTTDNGWSHIKLVRLSNSKALIVYKATNVTDTREKPYAVHVTLSGTPPTTLTISTPKNLKGAADGANWSSHHYGTHDLITGVANRVLIMEGYTHDRGYVVDTSGVDPVVAYELTADNFPFDSAGSNNSTYGWMDPNVTGRFIIHDDRNYYVYEVIFGSSSVTSVNLVEFVSGVNYNHGGQNASATVIGYERRHPHIRSQCADDDWRRNMDFTGGSAARIDERWNKRGGTSNIAQDPDHLINGNTARTSQYTDLKVPWRGSGGQQRVCLMEDNRWVMLSTLNDGAAPGESAEYEFASFEIPEF